MAEESDRDTSRTVVQTYVPAYQRDVWDDHAEELGMSRSEFVKAMVQAGRQYFGKEPAVPREQDRSTTDSTEDSDLEDEIQEHLAAAGPSSWEELLAGVTGDIETRLEDSLQELQEADVIRYSGRDGGYVLVEGSDE
jgi:hypothetical protein